MRSIKMNEVPCIISNSKVVRLPFYKRWLEYLLSKNPRLIGLFLAKLNKQVAHRTPDYIKIETTNACNGRCVYCPRDKMSRDIGTMDFDLYCRIIDQASQWRIKCIHLQNYGEPLIDPQIIDRVKYAKEKGIKWLSLFTNGMLLTERMVEKLVEGGLDEINISIDACSKEEHDNLRRNLSYDKIISNLRNLIEFRKRNKIFHPKIILASIIHTDSTNEVEDFINRWSGLVEEIHMQGVHDWAKKGAKKNVRYFPCFRVWLTFTILWDGRVSLCCVDYDGKNILGSVNDSRIQEIWNNAEYRKIRSMHLEGEDANPQICRNCTLRLKDSPLWIKKIFP